MFIFPIPKYNNPLEVARISNLAVHYPIQNAHGELTKVKALDQVSFQIKSGQRMGLVGESGSGKTTLALTMLGLIEESQQSGEIFYGDQPFLSLSSEEKKDWRWNYVSLVFQNSLEVLNPVMKVGPQILEPLWKKSKLSKKEASEELQQLLQWVQLDLAVQDAYPHQLSGGMRQRVLLAMALACRPKLLIMDEPTSSLDEATRRQITERINALQKELGFALLLISHDLRTVYELTDDVMVLYGGNVVEQGKTKSIVKKPYHPYTAGLLQASLDLFPYKDLWGIPGESYDGVERSGCPYVQRCTQQEWYCHEKKADLSSPEQERLVRCHFGGLRRLLQGIDISKNFGSASQQITAVTNCSIQVRHSETVALIGTSGAGKSTLAQIVAGFLPADQGKVMFMEKDITSQGASRQEKGIQLVLQDPYSSLSPRLSTFDAIEEPLRVNNIGTKEERKERICTLLKQLQLPFHDDFLARPCASLSGGQRQRVAIARALVMKPRLLIADEITSMLDLSTQANLLRLLKSLQNSMGFAMLFITHDLQVARKIADKIVVMDKGAIIEERSLDYYVESMESNAKASTSPVEVFSLSPTNPVEPVACSVAPVNSINKKEMSIG
ncbi:ABC transporter ATP-binding protein [Heliorestis convoluta]|uniref:Nickel import ATP-binding protein NikE n=1 Tax=Heliorestis convoluta TaxID=356322 RepID=A0A5Q2N9W0_9FIRM|nr:ABC transporter ATP-binding protein [Heliorestis convoluta]QGG49060.1 nickel import ATP-binding protein NikE [Heliorestis convoluta]